MNVQISNEDRVRWLDRHEMTVVYYICQDKTINETALITDLSTKTIQHYRSSAYRKLGLRYVKKENKIPRLKKDFCHIINSLIKSPKDLETWTGIDPYTKSIIVFKED